ncbi:transposase Orf2 [Pseudomonas synxantha]|jgi:hypothetical protein|nr:transposase Orf2 [Pseudomonas synxantha]
MLLTTKYVDGLPLHRFETVQSRHGIEIPRQTLARWIIQCSEHFQPLLNLIALTPNGPYQPPNKKGEAITASPLGVPL